VLVQKTARMLAIPARAGLATLAIAVATYFIAPSVAPLVAIAGAAAVLTFELSRVRVTLERRVSELEEEVAQTQPLLQLHAMLATRRPLPQMRGYAIAPDFGVMLAQTIADEKPELVLETGSGVSTLIIAYALEKLGRGRVVALEHDPEYARRTREELQRHGLERLATVVDAPLEPTRIGGREYRWYAQRALDDLGEIDLVVDDGPPRYVGDMLRYASLHVLSRRMSPRGLFVLDVVGEEERTILDRWRAELPELRQERLDTKKGNVLIRRAA
jgi:predicted O-methyltransferase YrrM